MLSGLLVYTRPDAAQNRRFIALCGEAALARGMELTLLYAEDILPGLFTAPQGPAQDPHDPPGAADVEHTLAGATFALVRVRDARVHRALEARGLRTFNNSRVATVANDKMLTYDMLHDNVSMLPTFRLSPACLPQAYPAVVKPANGHGGAGVSMVWDAQGALAAAEGLTDPLWQPALAGPARDMRCYVLGGEIVCCMLRESDTDFRSNYKLGGRARRAEPDEAARALVRKVCARLPLAYAGVDILWQNGQPVLNELEDPVGARMAYAAGVPMAELLFDYICREMRP